MVATRSVTVKLEGEKESMKADEDLRQHFKLSYPSPVRLPNEDESDFKERKKRNSHNRKVAKYRLKRKLGSEPVATNFSDVAAPRKPRHSYSNQSPFQLSMADLSTDIGDIFKNLTHRTVYNFPKALDKICKTRVATQIAFVAKKDATSLPSKDQCITQVTHDITNREYLIQVQHNTQWESLFSIKSSGLENAGLGLFAARPFKTGDVMGVYVGKVLPYTDRPQSFRAKNYSFKFQVQNYKFVMNPIVRDKRTDQPCRFGLHMANDPEWGKQSSERNDDNPLYNMRVHGDLLGIADRDIGIGEEIFLNYNFEFN